MSTMKPKIGALGVLIVLFQFVVLVTYHRSSLRSKPGNIQAPTLQDDDTKDRPFVTFVIPSRLNRSTLNQTLESLLNQTFSSWEAIVGIDVAMMEKQQPQQHSNHQEWTVESQSNKFLQDPRIRYCEITTTSKLRGYMQNGSGNVRNAIIKRYARGDWVAFVDDDDTLSPYYAETLHREVVLRKGDNVMEDNPAKLTNAKPKKQRRSKTDIIVFRMQGYLSKGRTRQSVRPDLNHDMTTFQVGDFGISFAVRRNVFRQHNMKFVTHFAEDYHFVRKAYMNGMGVKFSSCILYFVRRTPDPVREPPCGILDSDNDGENNSRLEFIKPESISWKK